jgi:hypothetical protein
VDGPSSPAANRIGRGGAGKEGVRLEKTTLQNVAPTYARLIGANAPKGPRDGRSARADLEEAQGHPHYRECMRSTLEATMKNQNSGPRVVKAIIALVAPRS